MIAGLDSSAHRCECKGSLREKRTILTVLAESLLWRFHSRKSSLVGNEVVYLHNALFP
jgi:hypothetical protein